jgi:hypothetical protein
MAYVAAFRTAGMPHGRVQGGTFCSLSNRGGFDGNLSRYMDVARAELASFSYHRYPVSHHGSHSARIPMATSAHCRLSAWH